MCAFRGMESDKMHIGFQFNYVFQSFENIFYKSSKNTDSIKLSPYYLSFMIYNRAYYYLHIEVYKLHVVYHINNTEPPRNSIQNVTLLSTLI